MADTKTTLTWLLKDEVSPTVGKIDKKLGGLEQKAGKAGPIGKLGGAFGALVSPLGLAVAGVTAFTGIMVNAVKGAIDEQKNIARLNTALKDNVIGWDGNTDAIEKQIAQRENLAFSDDALRESLGMLVTSTKDVTKAQDLQTIAMDLARAKNVDLGTATEAVIKLSQGSTREMKALGLAMDDGATAAQNLDKVGRATAGNAEAYAKTMAGKWETFQIKLQDVSEELGQVLLPALMGFADWLLSDGIPALAAFAQGFTDTVDGIKRVIYWLGILQPKAKETEKVLKGYIGGFGGAASLGGALRGMAEGGTTAPGWTWVGERGPELVRFSGGQQVYPAGQSAQMAAGGGGVPVEIPVILDNREIGRVVDQRLYLSLAGAGGSSRPR